MPRTSSPEAQPTREPVRTSALLLPRGWRSLARRTAQVKVEVTNVLTVRNRRIVYQEFFWDHAEALEAIASRE